MHADRIGHELHSAEDCRAGDEKAASGSLSRQRQWSGGAAVGKGLGEQANGSAHYLQQDGYIT